MMGWTMVPRAILPTSYFKKGKVRMVTISVFDQAHESVEFARLFMKDEKICMQDVKSSKVFSGVCFHFSSDMGSLEKREYGHRFALLDENNKTVYRKPFGKGEISRVEGSLEFQDIFGVQRTIVPFFHPLQHWRFGIQETDSIFYGRYVDLSSGSFIDLRRREHDNHLVLGLGLSLNQSQATLQVQSSCGAIIASKENIRISYEPNAIRINKGPEVFEGTLLGFYLDSDGIPYLELRDRRKNREDFEAPEKLCLKAHFKELEGELQIITRPNNIRHIMRPRRLSSGIWILERWGGSVFSEDFPHQGNLIYARYLVNRVREWRDENVSFLGLTWDRIYGKSFILR